VIVIQRSWHTTTNATDFLGYFVISSQRCEAQQTLVKLVAKSSDKTVILATRMNMESLSWGAQIIVMSVDR